MFMRAVHRFRFLPRDRIVVKLIFRAVGGRWLSASTEVLARTPRLHQTRILRVPFTHPPEGAGRMSIFGSGFGLRCFQLLSAGA